MTTEVQSATPTTTAPHPEVKIIKKKLNGYVGFANFPKQWHRKSVRRGFTLNVMTVGESGLGKTTLINTLFNKEILSSKDSELESSTTEDESKEDDIKVKIKSIEHEIEEDGVKLTLNVVTAPGFGESLNNTDSWKPIVEEINSRFDSYLEAESRINRAIIKDSRIHALLYFIEPTGHSLKSLDISLMKQVHEKVNLIPIIAKSDTLTDEEISDFKQRILADIQEQGIKTFIPVDYDDNTEDDETILKTKEILSKIPFAVIGSTKEVKNLEGKLVRGRQYPWGIIEVENENHNDFSYLRQLLIRQFLEELKEQTSNVLYENYRSEKLKKMGIEQDDSVFREFDPLTRQEEEKALHEAKLAKMEAEMKAVFQQKVSEKEKKLQRSEADLFSRHKEMKDKLGKQIKLLEEKKVQLEKQKTLPQEPPVAPAAQKSRKGFLR
ncbi:Septin-domain-containing protein [Scheffersomyces coipomensis]|uniref:Septin-domain-containing protein n=1 Tax=Scheffersomyces coipomensis TaxID=1788519 RepID=UPI00315CF151